MSSAFDLNLQKPIATNGTVSGKLDENLYASITCALTKVSSCQPSISDNTTTRVYRYCTGLKNEFKYPEDAYVSQTKIPVGLVCDTQPKCIQGIQYTCACYKDYSRSDRCNYNPSSSYSTSNSSSSLISSIGTIIPIAIVSIIALGCLTAYLSAACFGGRGCSPSNIKAYYAERRDQDKMLHSKQDLEREARRDEAVRIEANRVRREQELAQAFHQGVANRALREDKIKLTLEKARDEIVRKRHELTVKEMKRQKVLTEIMESSNDTQNQRLALRFKTALALRAAKREEELKASGNKIKVIEHDIIENGKVVGKRQEIQRERYARTDAEAGAMMGVIEKEVPHIAQPAAAFGGNEGRKGLGGNM
ncbi:hypothetical protein BJ741DRAFT_628569, partial [Chytriomyces cf. hyalinus JEL632]